MNVFVSSKKGQRESNEDRHLIITNRLEKKTEYPPIDIYGIFDGHGGNLVASVLAKLIPKIFYHKLSEPSIITYPLTRSATNKACVMIQNYLDTNFNKESKECGSTCLLIFRFTQTVTSSGKSKNTVADNSNDVINIVNVGDSRAIICSNNIGKQLTVDHKPLDPTEKQRILKHGGTIYSDGVEWRVGNLSLTRAFGDTTSQLTKPVPDVFVRKITKHDKFIVMACDGLWDVIDNQAVVNFILHHCYDPHTDARINTSFNIAEALAKYAIKLGSSDNVSVIVIFL